MHIYIVVLYNDVVVSCLVLWVMLDCLASGNIVCVVLSFYETYKEKKENIIVYPICHTPIFLFYSYMVGHLCKSLTIMMKMFQMKGCDLIII